MDSLRLLLVEDIEDDAALALRELREAGYELVAVERVATADTLLAALAGRAWDLITCDDTLPDPSALAALDLIRARDDNVPIVVVAEQIGALIRAGADDLVLKHNLQRLPAAVEQAWREAPSRRRPPRAHATPIDSAIETTERLPGTLPKR